MTFRKALCSVDFSPGSTEALRLATTLCTPDTQLVLIHVFQPYPYTFGTESGLTADIIANIEGDAERELANTKRQAESLGVRHVDTVFRTGSPWREIVRALEEDRGFDLAVIGTHGRTGISHMLLGSVAEKVVRHAPCPVLVARVRSE
jgi:universal stress protein A